MVEVELERLHEDATTPRRMTTDAAGHDLFACLGAGGSHVVLPGERDVVPTGWKLAIPIGYEGQVRPRSGLAFRHGITVLNGPGTIDADYRGELKVLLVNLGPEPFQIAHGERIAQLVIAPVVVARFEEVPALRGVQAHGSRGEGGFGSTGR